MLYRRSRHATIFKALLGYTDSIKYCIYLKPFVKSSLKANITKAIYRLSVSHSMSFIGHETRDGEILFLPNGLLQKLIVVTA